MRFFLISLFFASQLLAANIEKNRQRLEQTDILLENAKQTRKIFQSFTFSWTMVHGDKDRNHFEVDVLWSPEISKLTLFLVIEGEKKLISQTYMTKDSWYVVERDKKFRYRPFEAHYSMPTTYYYLMKSKVQFLNPKHLKVLGEFAKEEDGNCKFHKELNATKRAAFVKRIASLKNIYIPAAQTRAEEKYYLREASRLVKYVKEGEQNIVQKSSGVITRMEMPDGVLEVLNFQWVTIPDKTLLAPPKNYVDLTNEVKLKSSYLFGHNGDWVPGRINLQTDGRIVDAKTKGIRRIPFMGAVSTPFVADVDKGLVYITGIKFNSNDIIPYVYNTKTGKCTLIGPPPTRKRDLSWDHSKGLTKGHSGSLALSPDKKKLTLVHTPDPKKESEKDLIIIDLETNSIKRLRLSEIVLKVTWHSNNSYLYLSVLNAKEKSNSIKLLKGDGTPKKIIDSGAYPVLLQKTQKLLYLDKAVQLWKICDLDGKNSKIFKDGLPLLQYPSLSADEKEILMIKQDEEGRSIPVIYNIDQGKATRITDKPGLWLNPVWPN